MKTSELTDAALDWAVATAEGKFITRDPMGFGVRAANGGYWIFDENQQVGTHYCPSSRWSQGGLIIERERIVVGPWGVSTWAAKIGWNGRTNWLGPTPLVAAMRCYVASKLGDEVEVPADLLDDLRVA